MNFGNVYFFVNDANRFFAVFVAITTFMWLKNLSITHNKLINVIGSTTFGVLLIHANSDAMRTWLWKDTLDVVGHYSLPLFELTAYSFTITIVVFITCSTIDYARILLIEKPFFRWYDNNKKQTSEL